MVIEIKPEEIQSKLIDSPDLVMLLLWGKFDGPSIRAVQYQKELSEKYKRYMRFYSIEADQLNQEALSLLQPRIVPLSYFYYRGRLIERYITGPNRDLEIHVQAHLAWVRNYFDDYKPIIPDYWRPDIDHNIPEAAGWCTPGYNC